jgi:hypothetical protein
VGGRDSQRIAGHLLGDLWRLVRRASGFPNGNLTVGNTLTGATRSATDLADRCGGVAVVDLTDGSFCLNGERLLATSIRYRTLYRIMNTHGITSATFTSPVSPTDLADLAAQSAGITTDRPTGGTIRVNDEPSLQHRPDNTRLAGDEANRFRA